MQVISSILVQAISLSYFGNPNNNKKRNYLWVSNLKKLENNEWGFLAYRKWGKILDFFCYNVCYFLMGLLKFVWSFFFFDNLAWSNRIFLWDLFLCNWNLDLRQWFLWGGIFWLKDAGFSLIPTFICFLLYFLIYLNVFVLQLNEIKEIVSAMAGRGPEEVRVVVSPYRICPLGAHIDHQVLFNILFLIFSRCCDWKSTSISFINTGKDWSLFCNSMLAGWNCFGYDNK